MGGGSDKASKQAQQQEDQRQAQVAASTGQINSIFDNPSRTAQYQQLANDTTQYYMTDLDRQKAVNDRNLKFALARGGLTGGSVQADKSQQSGEDYLKGVIAAQRQGQAAGAALQSADQQSRASLIAAAQGGADATSSAANAAAALRANLQSNQASSTANSLGDAFGDFASLYQQSQDAKTLRQGQLYGYQSLYQPLYGGSP